jgi:thioredoxin-like negative regulator of GroEL
MVFRDGAAVLKLVGARPQARLARELSEVVPAREQVLVEQSAGS